LRASEIELDIDALETMELKLLSSLKAGESPGAASSILKLRASELRQSLTRLGLDAIGPDGIVWERRRPLWAIKESAFLPENKLAVLPAYLDGRAFSIFGGTSEVQRDLIARAVIGM
jgi:acyl-CoA dehydrogenase